LRFDTDLGAGGDGGAAARFRIGALAAAFSAAVFFTAVFFTAVFLAGIFLAGIFLATDFFGGDRGASPLRAPPLEGGGLSATREPPLRRDRSSIRLGALVPRSCATPTRFADLG
jgi:hypothetical protein